jgi:hypothetical protein
MPAILANAGGQALLLLVGWVGARVNLFQPADGYLSCTFIGAGNGAGHATLETQTGPKQNLSKPTPSRHLWTRLFRIEPSCFLFHG